MTGDNHWLSIPDRAVKLHAFYTAVADLFEQHPLPGNPDDPIKQKGRQRAERERDQILKDIASGIYSFEVEPLHPLRREILRRRCLRARAPEGRILAIHALLFGD
jgi:hypothetical protein